MNSENKLFSAGSWWDMAWALYILMLTTLCFTSAIIDTEVYIGTYELNMGQEAIGNEGASSSSHTYNNFKDPSNNFPSDHSSSIAISDHTSPQTRDAPVSTPTPVVGFVLDSDGNITINSRYIRVTVTPRGVLVLSTIFMGFFFYRLAGKFSGQVVISPNAFIHRILRPGAVNFVGPFVNPALGVTSAVGLFAMG